MALSWKKDCQNGSQDLQKILGNKRSKWNDNNNLLGNGNNINLAEIFSKIAQIRHWAEKKTLLVNVTLGKTLRDLL